MARIAYNPGEPVFDQETGEPYLDETGAFVEVAPGLKVQVAGRNPLDGDDVTNAAYYRGNKFEGETLRGPTIGVPYERVVLGQSDAGLAVAVIVGEIRRSTPGVAGIVDVRVRAFDPKQRVLQFTANLLREDGTEQAATLTIG